MNERDLFRAMSDLDEDLIMEPRKFVSLRMNFLLCILSACVSSIVPQKMPVLSLIVFFLAFGLMYAADTLWINRKRNRKLLVEDEKKKEKY